MTNPFERLVIDHGGPVPPYEQLRQWVAGSVSDHSLVAGTRLPTVRALAQQLGLAANTVAKAYRELEQAGIVVTRSRAGTVVAASEGEGPRRVAAAAAEFAAVVRANGVAPDEALRYAEAALGRK